jgi:hypothetical protein
LSDAVAPATLKRFVTAAAKVQEATAVNVIVTVQYLARAVKKTGSAKVPILRKTSLILQPVFAVIIARE